MTDTRLWIGFFLAVAGATAMLSYMLWYQATQRGIDNHRARWAIVQVWLAVVVGLCAGVGMRVLLGGAVVALNREPDRPLGMWVRALKTHESIAVVATMAVIALCFIWALRAVRSITGPLNNAAGDEPKGKAGS